MALDQNQRWKLDPAHVRRLEARLKEVADHRDLLQATLNALRDECARGRARVRVLESQVEELARQVGDVDSPEFWARQGDWQRAGQVRKRNEEKAQGIQTRL